jgi:preprotein translocase subunit SecB
VADDAAILTLVHAVVLDSIEFMELSARRAEDEDQPAGDEIPDGEGRMRFDYQAKELVPERDRDFRFALEVTFSNHEGQAVARPVAVYHVPADHAELLDDIELMIEFGTRVAVMTLIPYAREAIANLTSRVFTDPVLMPILTADQVHFSIIPPDDSHDTNHELDEQEAPADGDH